MLPLSDKYYIFTAPNPKWSGMWLLRGQHQAIIVPMKIISVKRKQRYTCRSASIEFYHKLHFHDDIIS